MSLILSNNFRCMGTPPSSSSMFSKGDNFHDFLIAHVEDEVFPKWGLKSKNFLRWEQILSFEMTLIYMAGNNEMTQLLPLTVYPFTLRYLDTK